MDEILCRACLAPQGKIKHNSMFIENGKIAKEIYKLTNLIILDLIEFNSPAVICQRCLMDLERAMSFRDLIIKSDGHLRELCSAKYDEVLEKLRDNLKSQNEPQISDKFNSIVKEEEFEVNCDEERNVLDELEHMNQSIDGEGPQISQEYENCLELYNGNVDDYLDPNDLLKDFEYQPRNLRKSSNAVVRSNRNIGSMSKYPKKSLKNMTTNSNRLSGQNYQDSHQNTSNIYHYNNESFEIHHIDAYTSENFKQEANLQSSIKISLHESKKPKRSIDNIQISYPASHSHDSESTKLQCKLCNKKFTKQCYLTQHFQTIHVAQKPFRCTKCGKRYSDQDGLNAHMEKHGDDKPFKCQMCSKSFNHKSDCKRHEIGHSVNKPFKCTLCERGFVRNDHLLKHIRGHKKRNEKKGNKNEETLGGG